MNYNELIPVELHFRRAENYFKRDTKFPIIKNMEKFYQTPHQY